MICKSDPLLTCSKKIYRWPNKRLCNWIQNDETTTAGRVEPTLGCSQYPRNNDRRRGVVATGVCQFPRRHYRTTSRDIIADSDSPRRRRAAPSTGTPPHDRKLNLADPAGVDGGRPWRRHGSVRLGSATTSCRCASVVRRTTSTAERVAMRRRRENIAGGDGRGIVGSMAAAAPRKDRDERCQFH